MSIHLRCTRDHDMHLTVKCEDGHIIFTAWHDPAGANSGGKTERCGIALGAIVENSVVSLLTRKLVKDSPRTLAFGVMSREEMRETERLTVTRISGGTARIVLSRYFANDVERQWVIHLSRTGVDLLCDFLNAGSVTPNSELTQPRFGLSF